MVNFQSLDQKEWVQYVFGVNQKRERSKNPWDVLFHIDDYLSAQNIFLFSFQIISLLRIAS